MHNPGLGVVVVWFQPGRLHDSYTISQVPASRAHVTNQFSSVAPFSVFLFLLFYSAGTMSFEGLQERLAALQETTSQLKDLIDRLANLDFQPGSVPLDTSEEGSVSGELSAEIGSLLRDGEDEKELLQEEIEYLRHAEKARLREGVERQGEELNRWVPRLPGTLSPTGSL